MRQNILFILAAVSATILVWNGITILNLPEQVTNVGAYKIIYFHVSAAFTAFTGFFTALVASLLYLKTGQLKYDAFAAGVTEVALAFATGNLVSGMIWGRFAWGIWWTWDARLTSMLVCLLMYYGYVMLRQAVTEPTQRARLSAVVSIFGCINVAFVYQSIAWYRTQHPAPVLSLRNGGGMSPQLESPIYWNWLALVCLGAVLASVRMRQGEFATQIDSLRRTAHSH
ncbi:MAG: cytochrome c biogenesis protein CcsA [Acidobacteriota bacterium]